MTRRGEVAGQIRIIIAERSDLLKRGMEQVLTADQGLVVIAEVSQPERLGDILSNRDADLIVIGLDSDLSLKRTLREIARLAQGTPVLAFLGNGSTTNVVQALKAGARGILLRDSTDELLVQASRAIASGACVLDPRLARRLAEHLSEKAQGPKLGGGPPEKRRTTEARLTPRELEVAESLARGLTNGEISLALGMNVGTVKVHVGKVLRKLGVRNRTEAALELLGAGRPRRRRA